MPSSSVPIIPQHKPDGLALATEALRDKAEADGNGILAYLLEIALRSAVASASATGPEIEQVRPAVGVNVGVPPEHFRNS